MYKPKLTESQTNIVPKPELNQTSPKINLKSSITMISIVGSVSNTIHEFKIAADADGVKVHHLAYQQRTSSVSNTFPRKLIAAKKNFSKGKYYLLQ